MKKSFLITLAAVSSVALIGCSSSSDDNGGNGGGGNTSTYAKPDVKVELVANDSTYLVQNVLNTNQGDNAADLQIKVVCNAATDEANLVVDNENNKIGYLASAATSDVKCTVTFDGEKDANTKTEITFNGTNDKTEKELVNVSKGKDAALTINGSDITFAADETPTVHTVTFKTVKAASYTKGKGVLTQEKVQDGVKLIKLAATDLDGVATIKTENCKDGKSGAISCEVELKSKSAVAGGKITATGATENQVVELVSNVVITEAGAPLPPTTQASFILDDTKLETHLDSSTWIKVPTKLEGKTDAIKAITCENTGSNCDAFFNQLADKSGFMLKLGDYEKAESKVTIKATFDNGEPLKLAKANLVSTIKGKVKPLYTIKEISCADGAAQETSKFTDIVLGANDAKCFEIATTDSALANYEANTGTAANGYAANDTKINAIEFTKNGATIAVDDDNWNISSITGLNGKTKCSGSGFQENQANTCVTKIKGEATPNTSVATLKLKTQGGPANTSAVQVATFKGKAQ